MAPLARRTLSRLTFAAALLAGATVAMGCGVSPAYAPVRTPVSAQAPSGGFASPGEAQAAEVAETAPASPTEYEDTDPAALTDFHDVLSPYGSWEEDAAYGTVWVPASDRVGSDFAPYKTAGHWELDTNDDWLWVSDYDDSFGWVVFHYGRWVYTDARGWVWIPGRRYAPAWVAWQTGDPGYGYVGWAPMPPTYYWRGGSYFWLDVYPSPYFVYCPTTYVFYRDWHTHAVPRSQVVAVATPMHPYGVPRGHGHVYASPHRGPSRQSGYVPPGSYPTSRHRMAEVSQRYAIPPAGRSAPRSAAGVGLGGSPRAGSHSRPYSFDPPGSARPSAFGSRTLGTTDTPGRPSAGPTRVAAPPSGPSAGVSGPTRIPSPPTAGRTGAFGPPSARGPSPSAFSGPTRLPSHSAPSRVPSPSFSVPSRASSPSYSAPTRMPSYSAPSHTPSFSAPSRSPSSFSHSSSSSSHSSARPSAPVHHAGGGVRGRR